MASPRRRGHHAPHAPCSGYRVKDMDAAGLSIGDLARATGTKVEPIRYYERTGLLPLPPRTGGNYRSLWSPASGAPELRSAGAESWLLDRTDQRPARSRRAA